MRTIEIMNDRTSFFQYVRALIQPAASLFRRTVEGASFVSPEHVSAEPYMESLPTRQPQPRKTQASRLTGFTQMGIDA